MKQKKVTFADIAAYTGFSKTTISRYFNNPDSLTLENQEKITHALDVLGYQENKLAKVLANGKSEFVGIIIPNLYLHYYSEMLNQLLSTYEKYNYKFLVFIGNNKKEIEEFFNEKQINVDITLSTRYVGYSIQQYSKRTFKTGERATAAYERVISEFHNQIKNTLNKFIKKGLRDDDLKIGDIPYVYSVIPLSQTANCPIFNLTYQEGLRGNQKTSVEKYKKYLENISKRLMFNVDRE